MGAEAGTAVATTVAEANRWRVKMDTKSSSWVDALYPIDDSMTSTWEPGVGTRGYTTRFREGRFHQDQVMRFGVDGVQVDRHQLVDGAWRDTSDSYAHPGAVEDPLSALWRLRTEALTGDIRFPVWTGKRVMTLRAKVGAREMIGATPAWKVVIGQDSHEIEDVEGRLTVWIADDDTRAPVQAAVKTKAGTVTAVLTGRTVP